VKTIAAPFVKNLETGDSYLTRTIHEYPLGRPIFSPGGAVLASLLDGLHIRFRRSYVREAPAGFGLERLATAFMKNPGYTNIGQAMYLIRNACVLCRILLFFQELPLSETSPRGWKAVHVNRKRFGAESNLIAGSRNIKVPGTISRRGRALQGRLLGQPVRSHRTGRAPTTRLSPDRQTGSWPES
jgi:hypothetical protein